jgi:hypothetical protein
MYKIMKYKQLWRKYGNQKPLFIVFFYKLYKDVKVFKNYFLTEMESCLGMLFFTNTIQIIIGNVKYWGH